MTNDATVDVEPEIDPLIETTETDPIQTETPEESSPSVDAKPDPVQARINKITADKYAEKRRADAAELKVKELEGANKPAPTSEEPTLEDSDFDETKHNAALIQYQVGQQLAAQAAQQRQTTVDEAKHTKATEFAAKEVEFEKSHPGYADVVANIPQLQPETLELVYNLGPEMAHYLGSHLDVADEIANATPMQAAVTLGRIAATMDATANTVTTTTAPEPVQTLKGAGGINKTTDEMSMDEIMGL